MDNRINESKMLNYLTQQPFQRVTRNLTPGKLAPGNLTPGKLAPGNLTPSKLTPEIPLGKTHSRPEYSPRENSLLQELTPENSLPSISLPNPFSKRGRKCPTG